MQTLVIPYKCLMKIITCVHLQAHIHTYMCMCLSTCACIDKMLIRQMAGNQRVTRILKSHKMSWKNRQLDSSGQLEALGQSKTNKSPYVCMYIVSECQCKIKMFNNCKLFVKTYIFITCAFMRTYKHTSIQMYAVGNEQSVC